MPSSDAILGTGLGDRFGVFRGGSRLLEGERIESRIVVTRSSEVREVTLERAMTRAVARSTMVRWAVRH
jgi:hypothetical protein